MSDITTGEAKTDPHGEWVKKVLGIDVMPVDGAAPASRRTATEQFVTGVGNVAGDIVSEAKIGIEAVDQGTRNVVDQVTAKGKYAVETVKGVLGWGPAGTAAPVGAVNLTSQTEEAQPANRARTRLGVGERVVLTVSGGAGNWLASGGTLSSKTGTTVTLTAPSRPASMRVTVDVGGTKRSLDFTVIAPSEVHMRRAGTFHVANMLPNAGFDGSVFIGPDDVNFVNTENYEDDIRAKADGCWDEFNGSGHSPSAATNGCSGNVVGGLGTASPGDDQIRSGWIPQPVPPNGDWSGSLTFNIPWHWKCGSSSGLIARVLHSCVTDAAGATTMSKAGATFTAALS